MSSVLLFSKPLQRHIFSTLAYAKEIYSGAISWPGGFVYKALMIWITLLFLILICISILNKMSLSLQSFPLYLASISIKSIYDQHLTLSLYIWHYSTLIINVETSTQRIVNSMICLDVDWYAGVIYCHTFSHILTHFMHISTTVCTMSSQLCRSYHHEMRSNEW